MPELERFVSRLLTMFLCFGSKRCTFKIFLLVCQLNSLHHILNWSSCLLDIWGLCQCCSRFLDINQGSGFHIQIFTRCMLCFFSTHFCALTLYFIGHPLFSIVRVSKSRSVSQLQRQKKKKVSNRLIDLNSNIIKLLLIINTFPLAEKLKWPCICTKHINT